MAKLTFNLELSRSVAKSTGMSHVLLRIQDDQHVKKRICTGIDVNPKNWSMRHLNVIVNSVFSSLLLVSSKVPLWARII